MRVKGIWPTGLGEASIVYSLANSSSAIGHQTTMSLESESGQDRIVTKEYGDAFLAYRSSASKVSPLLLLGDSKEVLLEIPGDSIDCVMTSPPYWGQREYDSGGIGQERTLSEHIANLEVILAQVKRILKDTGSFWLNIGDTYNDKGLMGIPWRLALKLTDNWGWVLRNSIVWNKMKSGMDNSRDRLGNIHENVFHFVKQPRGYYYNADAIRALPREARVENGLVVSSTGVSGVRYRTQIETSEDLSNEERTAAIKALDDAIKDMADGKLSDFRMIIRGTQRTTHSDSARVSGRAKEVRDKGFYIIRCHPNGSKPSDVWEIVPEDSQNRKLHFAPYPVELCRIPILATCPEDGIVLDPFCGTGTTMLAAQRFLRKSIGIDCSRQYLESASSRCDGM